MNLEPPAGFELLSEETLKLAVVVRLHHVELVKDLEKIINCPHAEVESGEDAELIQYDGFQAVVFKFLSQVIMRGGVWAWNIVDKPKLLSKSISVSPRTFPKTELFDALSGMIEVEPQTIEEASGAAKVQLSKVKEIHQGSIALVPEDSLRVTIALLSQSSDDHAISNQVQSISPRQQAYEFFMTLEKLPSSGARGEAVKILEEQGIFTSPSTAGRALKQACEERDQMPEKPKEV